MKRCAFVLGLAAAVLALQACQARPRRTYPAASAPVSDRTPRPSATRVTTEAAASQPKPVPRLTLAFEDADVRVVLDMILRMSGASGILSPHVKGTITVRVNEVPWTEVLEYVARTAGLMLIHEDSGIIRILQE